MAISAAPPRGTSSFSITNKFNGYTAKGYRIVSWKNGKSQSDYENDYRTPNTETSSGYSTQISGSKTVGAYESIQVYHYRDSGYRIDMYTGKSVGTSTMIGTYNNNLCYGDSVWEAIKSYCESKGYTAESGYEPEEPAKVKKDNQDSDPTNDWQWMGWYMIPDPEYGTEAGKYSETSDVTFSDSLTVRIFAVWKPPQCEIIFIDPSGINENHVMRDIMIKKIIAFVMVFIAAIFLLGAIYMFKTDKGRKYIKLYETEKKTYQSLSENGDKSPVESAKDLNTEAWGGITVSGTNINYPVMYTDNNEYYLTHDINKEKPSNGVPFLDYRCDGKILGFNSIIYGHNISGGRLFGALLKFKNKEYFYNHKTGILRTQDGIFEIEFFACDVTESESSLYKAVFITDKEKMQYLEDIKRDAVVIDENSVPDIRSRLVLLSTCSYEKKDTRTVLVGVIKNN